MKNKMDGRKATVSLALIAKSARLREKQTLKLLRLLVELESPSSDKAAVDGCMEFAAAVCHELGGVVRWHRQKNFGNLLEARFRARRGVDAKPLLLLGHLDTVW